MSVKVSVITLIKDLDSENASDLINSFFKQTLVEKELLVVTDETFDCQDGVKVLVNKHKEYSDKVNEAVEQAKEMGVEFYYPDIQPFKEKVLPLHDDMTTDKELKALYDKIQAKAQKEKN